MGNIYAKNGKPISKGGKLASAQKCCCKKPDACCISQIDDNVEDTSGFTEYEIASSIVLGDCVNVSCDDCSHGFRIQGHPHTVYRGACKKQCQSPCIIEPPPVCCCADGGCFPILNTESDHQKCEDAGGTVNISGGCGVPPYGTCEEQQTWENTGACCEDKGDGTTSCYVTTQCECEVGADYAGSVSRAFLGVGTTCEACCASPKHLCGQGEFAKCCEETETCCGEGENVVCCPEGWHCCDGVCQEQPCCTSDQDCVASMDAECIADPYQQRPKCVVWYIDTYAKMDENGNILNPDCDNEFLYPGLGPYNWTDVNAKTLEMGPGLEAINCAQTINSGAVVAYCCDGKCQTTPCNPLP